MTDAAGSGPTDASATSARDSERQRLLRQIADALAVPVSTFGRRRDAAPSRGPTAMECAALLTAFSRIEDPALRKACLTMVERYAAS